MLADWRIQPSVSLAGRASCNPIPNTVVKVMKITITTSARTGTHNLLPHKHHWTGIPDSGEVCSEWQWSMALLDDMSAWTLGGMVSWFVGFGLMG